MLELHALLVTHTEPERLSLTETLEVGLGPGFRETDGEELAVAVILARRVTMIEGVTVFVARIVMLALLFVGVVDIEKR